MKRRIMLAGVCLMGVVLGVAVPAGAAQNPPPTPCGPNLEAEIKNVRQDSRCFELRTYTVREGSSIDLLHARFRDRTTALFEKHGMTIIGYWQPTAKLETLIYMLAFPDRPARDTAWAAFGSDPEWVRTRNEMQVSIQVESVLMSATDYSPMQ